MAAPDLPAHDRLADNLDELGWDRSVHGSMADHADEATVSTVVYDAAADPFLTEG